MTKEKKPSSKNMPFGFSKESKESEDNIAADEQFIEECISIPAKDYALYQEEMNKTQQQAKEHFEGWQRERADFLNYKKRIERDNQLYTQAVTGDLAKKYLPIVDDIQRALKARPEKGEGAVWAEGIELIYRKLQSILESQGVARIPAEDQTFDPIFHEAISSEDHPDHNSGDIIEVVQDGYTIGDRVLRPALVRVAR